jgi:hypothetical protein
MSKTNDTSTLDHRELTDIELDGVTGGTIHIPMGLPIPVGGSPSLLGVMPAAISGALSVLSAL